MEQKFNKFLTTMLAVVLLTATMFVGCGENTPVNSTNIPATTTSTTFIYTVDPTDEITVESTERNLTLLIVCPQEMDMKYQTRKNILHLFFVT